MSADVANTDLVARLRTALHESQVRVAKLEKWHREQAAEASTLQRELSAARAEIGRLTRALALAGVGVP